MKLTAMNSTKCALFLAGSSVFLLCSHPSAIAQWVSQQIPSDAAMLLTVDFADSLHGVSSGWSQGFSGRAVYTTDGGAHWEMAIVPDSSRSLVTVQMINADTGYIAGAYNVPPGSATHSASIRKPSAPRPLARGVERFLQRIGCVLGDAYRALFLRTTDGGRTWQVPGVLPDSMGYLIGTSFVDGRTGYVTGDGLQSRTNVAILKTIDGGQHWNKMRLPESVAALRNIRTLDADHAVAVGYEKVDSVIQGVILATTNGGSTWEKSAFPAVDNFTDLFFAGAAVGYAVGVSTESHPIAYKTSDNGTTWQPLPFLSDTALLETVRFVPGTEEGIAAGEQTVSDGVGFGSVRPFVARTTDGGTSWVEEPIPSSSSFMVVPGADMLSHSRAYLSGGDGTVGALFRFDAGGTVSVHTGEKGSPASFSLCQNYPNPFNPSTVIEYTIAGTGGWGVGASVTLVVYDMLGRQVAVLADGAQSAGVHKVTWDGGGLAGGAYFCRLTAGTFVQTRTMMLVK